jgi:flagellar hook-associated protein 2
MGEAELAQLDAAIDVDGVSVTRSSNSIDDVIKGVTLNLESASASPITLDVTADHDQVVESVQSFVKSYNSVLKTINELHKAGTDGEGGGALEGDNTLLSIAGLLRDRLNTEVDTGGSYSSLAELGISTSTADGSLSLNSATLKEALAADYDSVANIFAKEGEGVAYRLEDIADELTTYGGLLETRTKGINQRIESLEDQKDNLDYRLQLTEERYKRQFGALDTMLAQMQSTSSQLMSQLSTLPGVG